MHTKSNYLVHLLSRTVVVGECRIWQGACNTDGYGSIRVPLCLVNEFGKRAALVHRMVFYLSTGVIPEELRHSCDRPPCIEITHLANGTRQDNVDDKVAKGRHAHSATSGASKLTLSQVFEIRALLEGVYIPEGRKRLPKGTFADLARHFGVSRQTVLYVYRGWTWK
jgi:hypothetical protein